MRTGTHVRISRQWHHPEIAIKVTDESIGINMPLRDFVKALATEIGNPATLFTQAALERRLLAATDTVVASMKAETIPIA